MAAASDDAAAVDLAGLFNDSPPDLLQKEIDSPTILDELWSAFFATGNPEIIKRICSVFEWDPSEMENDQDRQMILRAAEWSVGYHITEHETVRKTIETLIENAVPRAKKALERIVSKALTPHPPSP